MELSNTAMFLLLAPGVASVVLQVTAWAINRYVTRGDADENKRSAAFKELREEIDRLKESLAVMNTAIAELKVELRNFNKEHTSEMALRKARHR